MTRYIQKNNYETVELDGEWIILNTADYTVTKLNEVGGFCWLLLSEAQTADSLAQAVHEKYEWVTDTVDMDMERFLSELMQCGLIQHAS